RPSAFSFRACLTSSAGSVDCAAAGVGCAAARGASVRTLSAKTAAAREKRRMRRDYPTPPALGRALRRAHDGQHQNRDAPRAQRERLRPQRLEADAFEEDRSKDDE